MLAERFDELLLCLGNPLLEHPLFSHAPFALRFEIGHEKPLFLVDSSQKERVPNPRYLESAAKRAEAIYRALPEAPDLLCIEVYPEEASCKEAVKAEHAWISELIFQPDEVREYQLEEEGNPYVVRRFFWDLKERNFSPLPLLREIIRADLGGITELVSSVCFGSCERKYLYHVYDDRGADLVSAERESIEPLYRAFESWLLAYNRTEMDRMFLPGETGEDGA